MSQAVAARGSSAPTSTERKLPGGYFHRSTLPLNSLIFLLPLIILYEAGTYYFTTDPSGQTEQRIIAFTLMRDFFGYFGATGKYLPAMAVVGILLAWHIARNDPWRIEIGTTAAMAAESALLAVPLILMGSALMSYLPLLAVPHELRGVLVISLGAGIYEELVFRLIAFTVLSLVLGDLLHIPKQWLNPLVVLISAILFAAYHGLGNEVFQWNNFTFRTLAGIYFGGIFMARGFGITAGCHAAYDIFNELLRYGT